MIKLTEILGEKLITTRLAKIFEDNKHNNTKEVLKILLKDRLIIALTYWDMLKVVITEMQFHEDLREAFIKNIVTKGISVLNQYFKEGIEKGEFREVDSKVVIRSLVGMMGMYIIQKQLLPEIIEINDDEQLDIMIDLFLNGLSNKGE